MPPNVWGHKGNMMAKIHYNIHPSGVTNFFIERNLIIWVSSVFSFENHIAALYVFVYRTFAYVRMYHGIFRIYPPLYVEKDPISAWAEIHNLGWPK